MVCLVWLWVLGFPFALDFGWLADCCEFWWCVVYFGGVLLSAGWFWVRCYWFSSFLLFCGIVFA